ncbi:MAG: hypothetical protein A2X94_10885 [Bdellovibrionales bacterium GWB1_55_8]|nr:MAG: hypothetical protein A2X94_10885 [Bdellovibrionales bacterium GWB1_55_8]
MSALQRTILVSGLFLIVGTPVSVFAASDCDARARSLEEIYRRILPSKPEKDATQASQSLFILLKQAVSRKRIPGGTISFAEGSGAVNWMGHGTLSKSSSRKVSETTLYDLASLTKVVSTATSIHLLKEQGKIDLAATVSDYLPEFRNTGLGPVPISSLLRHRGGTVDIAVPRTADPGVNRRNYFAELKKKGFSPPLFSTGNFHYTDAAYVLLGEVVERVSGQPINDFAEAQIFGPLGMRHTRFKPGQNSVCSRTIAGTRPCIVHDPIARSFGGVSGNAGLFSTARDLAKFARMILDHGQAEDSSGQRFQFLSQNSVQAMSSDPAHLEHRRGMGFDIDSPFACAPRGRFPQSSFGHTGYTGTSLWIDPSSRRFIVLLTNEVEIGKGPIDAIRWHAGNIVSRYR